MANTHFSGPVTVGSGRMETITAAKILNSDDNGKTFLLNGTGGGAITLPPVASSSGFKCKFIVASLFTTNWVITAQTAVLYGVIMELSTAQLVSTGTTLTMLNATDTIGDWIEVESDGINWYVSGNFAQALSITPA